MPDAPLSGRWFCAVGDDGLRVFSRDGVSWTNSQTGKEGLIYTTVAFGGGYCVAAGRYGGNSVFASTADGAKWETSERDAQYSKFVRAITFRDGKFLILGGSSGGGDSEPYILQSDSGQKWSEPQRISGKNLIRRFAQGEERIVGVGDYGRRSASKDGLKWEDAKEAKAVDTLIDVAYGKGLFVGGGLHGLRMRSIDGLAWTDRTVGEEGEHINAMLWDGRQFVGVGQGATYFSPDGQKWERKPNKNAPTTAVFGDGLFVGLLYKGKILTSRDAVDWKESARLPQHVETLAFGTLGKL